MDEEVDSVVTSLERGGRLAVGAEVSAPQAAKIEHSPIASNRCRCIFVIFFASPLTSTMSISSIRAI